MFVCRRYHEVGGFKFSQSMAGVGSVRGRGILAHEGVCVKLRILGRGGGEHCTEKQLPCKPLVWQLQRMPHPAALQPLQPLLNGRLLTYHQQVFIADLAVAATSTRSPTAAAQNLSQLLALHRGDQLRPLQLLR